MTKKRDKKLEAEITTAMILNMARDAVSEKKISPAKRQARAVFNELIFATCVIADDKEKRKLRKEIADLQKALAKACDLAIDAADVIVDEGICDPEDNEDTDFRAMIAKLHEKTKQPESERHIERRKQKIAEKITDEMVEQHARQRSPDLWKKIDTNADDNDWNGAASLNARNMSLTESRRILEQEASS